LFSIASRDAPRHCSSHSVRKACLRRARIAHRGASSFVPMPSEQSIYRISPWRRAVLWCALGPFVALGLGLWALGPDESTRAAGAVVVAVMAVCLGGWQWLVSRTTLVLTPAGVQLRQAGMHLAASWSDVQALCLVRGREGLVLRTPLAGRGAARLAALSGIAVGGAPLYDDEQRALMRERRFIPIEAFAWHAYHGTLATDVARLAPHVCAGATTPTAKPRAAQPMYLLAAALLLVAIVIGAWLTFASANTQGWIATVVQCTVAPSMALGAGVSTWSALRARAVLVGTLFAASTLVTGAWTLIAWIQLVGLLDS
jgi:hypothetical protein